VTGFRIAGFSGLVPRLAKQLLAANQAQVATNCNLTSGDLRPRNAPLPIFNPIIDGDIVSMFRMEKDGNEKWLAWSKDVDVARSPVANNVERWFYYTGDGEPRVSNFDLATQGAGPYPSGCYVLGVTPPVTAPTVGSAGGASADEVTRVYVYTFVTQAGEESEPSPPTSLTGKADDTWTISGMDGVPPISGSVTNAVKDSPSAGYVTVTLNTVFGLRAYEEIAFTSVAGMSDLNGVFPLESVDPNTNTVVVVLSTAQSYTSGGTWDRVAPHNIVGMTKRIYRTVTTTNTGAEYQYVVTLSGATTSYTDSLSDEAIADAGLLPSAKWHMPPANMRGIIILPNGIAAGFTGNEIHFSEPFKPYAWPDDYRQSYDQDIVAIGVTGTTLVGMTKGNPFTITGVDPLTMGGGMEKLPVAWPCMSKRSVATFVFGVGYAAPQGLVIIGVQNDTVTKDLFTQKEWSELNPQSFIAATGDNRYYAGHQVEGSSLMFVIDKGEAASFLRINQKISAIWTDPATGKLYVANDRKIYQWEGDIGGKLIYEWRSKQFLSGPPLNYGAAKIDADFGMTEEEIAAAQATHDAAITANEAFIASGGMNDGLADPALGEYGVGGDALPVVPPLVIDALQFQLWCDGKLRHSRQVLNNRAFRLPAGYKSDNAEVVLSGNVKVSGVVLAETMDGLKQA
jgi:hypothetical protein